MGVGPLIFNLLKLSIQRPSGYHAQSKGGSWVWCAGWVWVGCVLVGRCRYCWLGNILVCFHWDENPPWVSGAACDPEPAPRGARAWGPRAVEAPPPPTRRLWFAGGAVGRGASPQIRGRCGRAGCAASDSGAVRSGGVHRLRALRGRVAGAALPTMASSSSAGAAGAPPLPVVASSMSVIIGLGQNGYGHGVCVCPDLSQVSVILLFVWGP